MMICISKEVKDEIYNLINTITLDKNKVQTLINEIEQKTYTVLDWATCKADADIRDVLVNKFPFRDDNFDFIEALECENFCQTEDVEFCEELCQIYQAIDIDTNRPIRGLGNLGCKVCHLYHFMEDTQENKDKFQKLIGILTQ